MTTTQKRFFSGLILTVLSLAIMSASCPVSAQNSLFESQTGLSEIGAQAYGNSNAVDIRITIGKIINIALAFLATIMVLLVIVAGFQYMLAGGNEETTKKAISLIKNAIIGLLIIIVSWAISRFVLVVLDRTAKNAVDYTNAGRYGY